LRAVIDRSVYPDVPHGDEFIDEYDRADGWRDVFDRFPIADSPSYHGLRAHFRWPAVPMERSLYPAPWETLDALEGRDDPCRDQV
jgi:hypothetical protein